MTPVSASIAPTGCGGTPPAVCPNQAAGDFLKQVNIWDRVQSVMDRAAMVIVGRVRSMQSPRQSENTSGSARITSRTGKPVSPQRLPLIMAERELLIWQIAENQRHHKATYSAAKRLRQITHEQLQIELTGKEPS